MKVGVFAVVSIAAILCSYAAVRADVAEPTEGNPTNALSAALSTNVPNIVTAAPGISNAPVSALVGEAISQAEAASEKAGVEYYGKERTGILGNRLWFADVGAVISQYSDEDVDLDTGIAFSTGFNFPLAKHIDFGFGLSYSRQSGTVLVYDEVPYTVYDLYYSYYYYYYVPRTVYQPIVYEEEFEVSTFSGNATLTLSLLPDKPINPFVIGGGYYVNQEIDVGGSADSLSDSGFAYGGGIEFKLGKKVSFVPSILHSEAGDAEETSIGALLSYWYAFRHAFRIGGAYGTESENIVASIGWMYGF